MKMKLISLVGMFFVAWAVQGCGSGGNDCTPNAKTLCREGATYWVDSCGNEGNKAGDCDCGCNADFSGCKTPCECTPSCGGKECGPDGCGGTCAPGCGAGEACDELTGKCVTCECSAGELSCLGDASILVCENNCDWTEYDCLTGCQESGYATTTGCDYSPTSGHDVCLCCNPGCDGKECGPDGCGGTCSPGCPDSIHVICNEYNKCECDPPPTSEWPHCSHPECCPYCGETCAGRGMSCPC